MAEPTPFSEDQAFQELLADFTHTNTLTDLPSSVDPAKAAISIDLSPEFVIGLKSMSELTASELSTSLNRSVAEGSGIEIFSVPETLGNHPAPLASTQLEEAPSFLDLLPPFSSGNTSSFDLSCLPPSLVAL